MPDLIAITAEAIVWLALRDAAWLSWRGARWVIA